MKDDKSVLEVRATPVGHGLFARRSFRAEACISEVLGEIFDDSEYESDYCMHLEGDAKLEPAAPWRFLNHSCEPNCELILWRTRKHGGRRYPRLWLQALRPVRRGDELTIDYAWPSEAAIPCLCRSGACRGWIVDPDELSQLLENVAGGRFTPREHHLPPSSARPAARGRASR